MASSLTHRDLSRQLGVSETTVKSYRRKFPGCIPVANEGKPIRFEPAAAAVCERIRDLFATGMAVAEIRRRLAREFDWITEEDEAAPAPVRASEPAPAAPVPSRPAQPPREGQEKILASLSTLAKSVVSLSLEHSSILKRLEKLVDQPQALFAPFESAFAALHERLERQELLLARLETLVGHLGRHGSPLAGRSPVFQPQEAETPPASSSREEKASLAEEELPLPSLESADGRRDLFFEGSSKGEKTKTDKKFQRWAEYPFLAQNAAGQYVNIRRPRFSINALRAVLADRIAFPERYALACYESGEDTWLTLTVSGPRRSLSWRLLLVPARTTKKNDVILAERAFLDEEEVPTALFHEFVDELMD